ncbi:TPA: hypothetical protein I7730_16360 [Vibrio vulnificus]|uniref:Uncharacterized protein n=1 Tax=Vibrio vulnificus TaxID=672 RepID=A0A8H9TGF6_VIBVL|nr:hypothetical protein [Vibrio vulnificus]HAS8541358.1 hypothetical protein [Vibrio vulnificus]
MNIRVKKITLCLSVTLGVSCPSFAGLVPSVGAVEVLLPPAIKPITDIQAEFVNYDTMVARSVRGALLNVSSAVTDANMQATKAALQASQMDSKNQIEITRASQGLQNEYKRSLSEAKAKSKNELIPLDNSPTGPSRAYFARLCAADKLNNGVFSASAAARVAKLSSSQAARDEKLINMPSLAQAKKVAIVKEHYESFCDENDVTSGLCKVESLIPNADLMSFVFLNPLNEDGFRTVKEHGYSTRFTYSDFEKKAAKNYIDHVVPLHLLPRQSLASDAKSGNVQKTSRQNQLLAGLNLARSGFQAAYSNRDPIINDGKVRLSKLDMLGLSLAKARADLSSVQAASEKGKMVFLLSAEHQARQIDAQKLEYKKRINEILAATAAIRRSDPVELGYLETIR